MPRVCHFTGKSTRTGNKYRLRGRPKYLGGVGTKITACTKRKFKPNLQNVNALIDGQIQEGQGLRKGHSTRLGRETIQAKVHLDQETSC